MREKLLLGIGAGALVGAMVSLSSVGCGGSSAANDAATVDDATTDVTVSPDSALDGGKDASDAPKPCLSDADLNTYAAPDVNVPDSSLNMATCVSCLRQKCKSTIDACQALCECREVVTDALDCLGNGNGLTCAAGLQNASPATQNIGVGLLQCINKDCPAECPLTGVPGLPDGSVGDGSVTDGNTPKPDTGTADASTPTPADAAVGG